MSDSQRRAGVHYAWVIVFACVLLSAASTGILSYFGALFVEPVTESLGLSRTEFTVYTTFSTVTSMLIMPVLADIYRRVPAKAMLTIGALAGAASMFLFASASALPVFYAGAVLSGVCISFCGGLPIATLLNNWFNERRGLATGIAFMGPGLFSALLSPIVSQVIASSGWRAGYLLLGALVLLGIIPVTFLLVRMRPAEMGLEPYGGAASESSGAASTEQSGLSRRQALRHPAFHLFMFSSFLVGLLTFGTQQHVVAYWTQASGDATAAAGAYSIVMLFAAVGKVALGGLFDRLSVRTASCVSGLTILVAMLALVLLPGQPVMLLAAVLVGLTIPLQVMLPTYLTGRLFGQRDYGALYGISSSLLFLGAGVGAPLSASLFDLTGGYLASWLVFAALALLLTASLVVADALSASSRQAADAPTGRI